MQIIRKAITTIALIIVIYSVTWAQSSCKPFGIDTIEVKNYLNSMIFKYSEHLYRKDLVVELKFDNSTYKQYSYVFSDSAVLLKESGLKSDAMMKLYSGDTLWVPIFRKGSTTYKLIFLYPCGDFCENSLIFCVTKNGNYGFINYKDLINSSSIYPIPDSDFNIIKSYRIGVAKKDFSKYKIFNTTDINYSDSKSKLVYAKDDELDPDYKSIYIFNLNTWTQKQVANGFRPMFYNDDILYWNKEENKQEKVFLLNSESKIDKLIFEIPDSLTLWGCGPDFCAPHKLLINETNNGKLIILPCCATVLRADDIDECGRGAVFVIDEEGEIIERR